MKVAFDLDDTLIPTTKPFAIGCASLPFPLHFFLKDKLRNGSEQLLKDIQQDHELWIYTTSLRTPFYIENWLRCWGVHVDGVINQTRHDEEVQGTKHQRFSKAPALFGIDLLIDDQPCVAEECHLQGTKPLIISPDDMYWTEKVRKALDGEVH